MAEDWTLADWDNYWVSTQPSREVVLAQRRWVRRVIRFAKNVNVQLDVIADIGCGPAIALFELARKFPKTSFHGFDGSSAIIERNTERARNLYIRNISFSKILLPKVPKKSVFSLVLCIATLHYVKDSLLTIRNLYSILKPGGFLIFNYPNLYTGY